MRPLLKALGLVHLAILGFLATAAGQTSQMAERPRTFALETFARRSLNYLNRMVDTNGLPYFNIFWTMATPRFQ